MIPYAPLDQDAPTAIDVADDALLHAGSTVSVLLAEPDDIAAALVRALLVEALPQAVVTTCRTGSQALENVRRRRFDVVVTGLALPDLQGLAVVDVLREGGHALVLLAEPDQPHRTLEAMARGALAHLVVERAVARDVAATVLQAVQRRRAQVRSERPPAVAQEILDALEAPTCAVDATSRILAVNAAWRQTTAEGEGRSALCGVGVDYLAACAVAGPDPDAVLARSVAAGLTDVLSGEADRFQIEYPFHSSERRRWFSLRITPLQVDGGPGAVITHVEVTEMRAAQEALAHQALHDTLTGLPNRLLLTDRLRQSLSDSARRGTEVAVAFIDLDQFKRVNDTLGHTAGDALLKQVGRRLSREIRAGDTLARFSGDEFVVVWRDLHDPQEAELLSERLAACLSTPFELGVASVVVSASIGVAVGRSPQSCEELLLAADAAMYDAKGHGRGRVKVFGPQLRHDGEERMATERGLRQALSQSQLVLHYQPVVDVATGRPCGAEALVRWNHPVQGLLGPERFIPVAEATGLIVPVGCWVLQQACHDAASWTGELADLEVAVNLSVRQLTQPDVLRHVHDALESSGLAPSRLLLEVTESAVMEDADAAGIALEALAELGVRIAIDDFGTGYSSMLYLRRFPISALKVDRAFVAGLGSVDDDAICSSVVGLAHAVGATSIAEGVETVEQLLALRTLGCQQAQGFLFSRPVPVADLPAAIEACSLVEIPGPVPAVRRPAYGRRRAEIQPGPAVEQRIMQMRDAGASMHTIAAALNHEGARHPSGVRWHSRAVQRYLDLHPALT